MTPTVPDQPWGQVLRNYRKRVDLTQGQFVERLSLLIANIEREDRAALETIDVFEEAANYFGGVLDSPTLSRLEKGSRNLSSRRRCIALIWGLRSLGVFDGPGEANNFLELAGHGNLTEAEELAVLGTHARASDERSRVGSSGSSIDDSATGDPENLDSVVLETAGSGPDEHMVPTGPEDAVESLADRSLSGRDRRALLLVGAAVAVVIAGLAVAVLLSDGDPSGTAAAQIRSHVLLTDELQSATGEIGNDQALSSLHEPDQTGEDYEWPRFVKFLPGEKGAYLGYRAYDIPSHIPVDSIVGIRLEASYRGPDYETAPWFWEAQHSDTNEPIRLGDNRDSKQWSDWTRTSFVFPSEGETFDASTYVNDGRIWVSLNGPQAASSLDMDYEALVVEWVEEN